MKTKTKLIGAFFVLTALSFIPAYGSAIIQSVETVAIEDTYIYELEPDDTHGSEAKVRVGRDAFGVFPLPIVLVELEGFFKFDLSFDVDKVENVTKVKLVLPITDSVRSGTANKQMVYDVWEINDVFDESTTWNNQPVTWDFQLENIIIETDADVPSQFEVDITSHIADRGINISDNIFSVGVRRVDTHDTRGYVDFGSSESTSKPVIVLEYDDGIAKPWWILLWEFLISPWILLFNILAGLFGFAIVKNKRAVKRIKNIGF